MHPITVRRSLAGSAGALCLLLLTGCGGRHHHLASYDFGGRTLGVVTLGATAPSLRSGAIGGGGSEDAVGILVTTGSRVAKEVEARRVQALLDSAEATVGLADRMSRRTAERAARYLGAHVVPGSAVPDYLLELRVQRYGIDARGSSAPAHVFVDAEAVLLESASGVEIWSTHVHGWDSLTPRVGDTGPVPGEIVTAGALTTVTLERLQRSLEAVADVSADAITNELREELREVRERRTRR